MPQLFMPYRVMVTVAQARASTHMDGSFRIDNCVCQVVRGRAVSPAGTAA